MLGEPPEAFPLVSPGELSCAETSSLRACAEGSFPYGLSILGVNPLRYKPRYPKEIAPHEGRSSGSAKRTYVCLSQSLSLALSVCLCLTDRLCAGWLGGLCYDSPPIAGRRRRRNAYLRNELSRPLVFLKTRTGTVESINILVPIIASVTHDRLTSNLTQFSKFSCTRGCAECAPPLR